jgi:hypothetical protein
VANFFSSSIASILTFISFMFIYAMRVHIYRSTFIIFFYPNSFYLINDINGICHLDLVVAFLLILFVDLAIHFLSRALCHFGLLRSFSDNFVCCLSLLHQRHSFDSIIYCHHHHIILFHYLPFAVVHHIISSV